MSSSRRWNWVAAAVAIAMALVATHIPARAGQAAASMAVHKPVL